MLKILSLTYHFLLTYFIIFVFFLYFGRYLHKCCDSRLLKFFEAFLGLGFLLYWILIILLLLQLIRVIKLTRQQTWVTFSLVILTTINYIIYWDDL